VANNAPQHVWFKAKRYGWGWTPCSPAGWLVTTLGATALIAGDLVAVLMSGSAPDRGTIVLLVLGWNALVVAVLIGVCWKTGERPRWRWGRD
jgi:hypothetical protein